MIIKSLSRKSTGGARGGKSPFKTLVRYMTRGIEEEEGRAVLWHNFFGHDDMSEKDILEIFESNASRLKQRKNGNVLYHEILSFSEGHTLSGEKLYRAVADIGQEYLRERAPNQLGYGVIHLDTDNIHLHSKAEAYILKIIFRFDISLSKRSGSTPILKIICPLTYHLFTISSFQQFFLNTFFLLFHRPILTNHYRYYITYLLII